MFEPGTLWSKAVKRTKQATDKGVLLTAVCDQEFIVPQYDIPFVVRVAPNLHRKDTARRAQDQETQRLGHEPNPLSQENDAQNQENDTLNLH